MSSESVIQRQYDEVIASNYDRDPKDILASSFKRAMEQFEAANLLQADASLRTLDIGLGTGSFLANLVALNKGKVEPFGLDLSEEMLNIARIKIPNLQAVADTASNLENHFINQSFDLICTHFVTGFVPMQELAPKIWHRLAKGGYWSLIGQSMAGYPHLRKEMDSTKFKLFSWLLGSGSLEINSMVCNPEDHNKTLEILQSNGFEICSAETFEPDVDFADLEEFIEFGYHGGWLTPFIEVSGLHQASKLMTAMVNPLFFPFNDHLSIEIALVRKIS